MLSSRILMSSASAAARMFSSAPLGDHERTGAAVFVGVVERGGVSVVFAGRVTDQPFQLAPPVLVAQREEAQEDQRQDVALVVGRFDGAAQVDRRLPELFGQGREEAPPGVAV